MKLSTLTSESTTKPDAAPETPQTPQTQSSAKAEVQSAGLGETGDASDTGDTGDTGDPCDTGMEDDGEDSEGNNGWQEWLQSRLHSWGMLSLVDEVIHAACSGDLSACTDMMEKVAVHGEEFEQSLAKTPLPSYVNTILPMPPHIVAPSNIWDWLLWRVELLEDAEYRVTTLLGKASTLVDSVMGASLRGPMRSDSMKHPHSSSTDRRRTLNVKKLMQGMQTLQAPEALARSNSNISQPPRNSSFSSQAPGRSSSVSSNRSQTTDGNAPEKSSNQSGFHRFKKIAGLVLSHVRAKKQDGMVLNTKLLTCISMQTKVTQTQDELAALIKEVDDWPPLISQTRSSCDDMQSRLREASQTLFERFVDLRQHVEVELREVTLGDQGIVDCPLLESKIIDVQRELSSSLLLGEFALQRADQLGVSLGSPVVPFSPFFF